MISWTGGADFTQTVIASPFSVQVIEIPAGVVNTGQGVLIVAVAATSTHALSDFGSGATNGVLSVMLYDPSFTLLASANVPAGGDSLPTNNLTGATSPHPAGFMYLGGARFFRVPLPAAGGWIFVGAHDASAGSPNFVRGTLVAAIDDTAFASGEASQVFVEDAFRRPESELPIFGSDSSLLPPADLVFGDAEYVAQQTIAAPSFSQTGSFVPQWTDVITRTRDPSYCLNVTQTVGVLDDPLTQIMVPSGAIPDGALYVIVDVFLQTSGIEVHGTPTQLVAQLFVSSTGAGGFYDNSGAFVFDRDPVSLQIVVGFAVTMGLSIQANIGSPDSIFITVGGSERLRDLLGFPVTHLIYEATIWCSDQSLAVGIGQYTGAPTTGAAYHLTAATSTPVVVDGVPINDFVPDTQVATGRAGFIEVYPAPIVQRTRSFVQMIGD